VPLQFQLTSASVMNAFFIPQFGSMIYTMNGIATRLNLRADAPGTFQGLSAQFSGDGFADMLFDVHVVPSAQFSKWAQDASNVQPALDARSYQQIATPSMKTAPATYRLADPDIFASIVTQKLPPSPGMQAGVKEPRRPRGSPMLGKLTWDAIPFDQPIPMIASGVVALGILAMLGWVVIRGIYRICGGNGSPASTTSASA